MDKFVRLNRNKQSVNKQTMGSKLGSFNLKDSCLFELHASRGLLPVSALPIECATEQGIRAGYGPVRTTELN